MATTKALAIDDGDLAKSFLGVRTRTYSDVDLFFVPVVGTGDVYKRKDGEAVKQSIKNLLMTNRLEKPFQPNFGADFQSLLFDLADPFLEIDLETKIKYVIESYEPRAEFLGAKVNGQPDKNSVSVTIKFRIKNSSQIVSLTTTINRLR